MESSKQTKFLLFKSEVTFNPPTLNNKHIGYYMAN